MAEVMSSGGVVLEWLLPLVTRPAGGSPGPNGVGGSNKRKLSFGDSSDSGNGSGNRKKYKKTKKLKKQMASKRSGACNAEVLADVRVPLHMMKNMKKKGSRAHPTEGLTKEEDGTVVEGSLFQKMEKHLESVAAGIVVSVKTIDDAMVEYLAQCSKEVNNVSYRMVAKNMERIRSMLHRGGWTIVENLLVTGADVKGIVREKDADEKHFCEVNGPAVVARCGSVLDFKTESTDPNMPQRLADRVFAASCTKHFTSWLRAKKFM